MVMESDCSVLSGLSHAELFGQMCQWFPGGWNFSTVCNYQGQQRTHLLQYPFRQRLHHQNVMGSGDGVCGRAEQLSSRCWLFQGNSQSAQLCQLL